MTPGAPDPHLAVGADPQLDRHRQPDRAGRAGAGQGVGGDLAGRLGHAVRLEHGAPPAGLEPVQHRHRQRGGGGSDEPDRRRQPIAAGFGGEDREDRRHGVDPRDAAVTDEAGEAGPVEAVVEHHHPARDQRPEDGDDLGVDVEQRQRVEAAIGRRQPVVHRDGAGDVQQLGLAQPDGLARARGPRAEQQHAPGVAGARRGGAPEPRRQQVVGDAVGGEPEVVPGRGGGEDQVGAGAAQQLAVRWGGRRGVERDDGGAGGDERDEEGREAERLGGQQADDLPRDARAVPRLGDAGRPAAGRRPVAAGGLEPPGVRVRPPGPEDTGEIPLLIAHVPSSRRSPGPLPRRPIATGSQPAMARMSVACWLP